MRFYHYRLMQRLLARRQASWNALDHLVQQTLVEEGNAIPVPFTDRCDDAVES